MATKKIKFTAFGETLHVLSVGPVYTAPCCGSQYGTLWQAVVREVASLGRASGASDEEIDEEAIDAYDRANGRDPVIERLRDRILEAGAVKERREDRHGVTRSGWWLDGVFLGKTEKDAAAAIDG